MLMNVLLKISEEQRSYSFVLLFSIFLHSLSYHIPESYSEYYDLSEFY